MSSIDHVHESESADALAEQIAVDGKVGSDTDGEEHLKTETALKDGLDTPHHVRSNSVKKPTTFKAVSVTKNFLAKAGTPSGTPPPKTNGDAAPATPGATMPPAPRPRLVAKTASGTQGAGPNNASLSSKNGTSGPDPMQVWNRNRAAPQPTQKHFTDEELKQQYGIHLATRLQADSDGKEAKWADIDDDEDDWAPEAIEWNDGTKIDLTANNAAILAAEQAAAEAEKQRQDEEERAKSVLQQPTTTVGPNATVLKPRSAAQPKAGGLVLKTPSEKPSLVSKPTAPTPVRSPWASLPPVDKIAPIAINPDAPNSASRPQGYDAYPNAYPNQPQQTPPPAMEIAADSFSRNRGDAANGHPGQLYNAQSGRYEPANTGRRGSVRKDQNFRPPSLLQRGSTNDTRGPAGPSEAFQTRSAGQQDQAPWARRRSSHVSGEEGQARRNSIIKGMPNGVHDERRDSEHSQALQSPTISGFGRGSIPRDGSPALPQSAVQSPAMRHAQMADPRSDAGSPNQTREDIIAQQKQTMKEKRELAIKRKQEEEAREEAAKKERIRLRMEALGMPPLDDKKDLVKKEAQKSIEKRPAESPKPVENEDEKVVTTQKPSPVPAQHQDQTAAPPKSPPKPPIPNASGAPQQYGMMKVHGAPTNNMQQSDNERLQIEKTRSQAAGQKTSPSGLQSRPTAKESMPSPLVNGIKHPESSIDKAPEASNQHQIREQPRQQPWNQVPNDQKALAGAGWGSQAATRESSNAPNNVWGAPNARSLGNGAFDRSVQRPQSRQQEQFATPALAPIGPPKHLQSSRDSRESGRGNDTRNIEDFQTIPTFPPTEGQPSKPDPIGQRTNTELQKPTPPQYVSGLHSSKPQINQSESVLRPQDQQKSSLAAWGNFQATSTQEEAMKRQQHSAKLAEETRQGVQREAPQLPLMHETWRQVKVDNQSTQRSIIRVEKGQATHGQGSGPHVNADLGNPAFAPSMAMGPSAPGGMGRGSRFFPSTGRGVSMPMHTHPAPFAPGHRRGSSPPPPDSEGHPAFVRDQSRPRVSLPMVGPRPKVKLPPSMTSPAHSPRMAEVQPVALRSASQPLVSNPSWQDRFNGLLGVKKTSPERTFARPVAPIVTSISSSSNKVTSVFSASKEPLLSPTLIAPPAAVFLPTTEPSSIAPGFKVESKDAADEEELFIPESGSLPVARLPLEEPTGPWGTAKVTKRPANKPTRLSKEVEPISKESKEDLIFADMVVNGSALIFVYLKGMRDRKSRPLTGKANEQNNTSRGDARLEQQQPRPRNFSGGSKPQGKGFKGRQSTGNVGSNSPRTNDVRGPHSKSSHHNALHTPNRVQSTVSAVGGWESNHAR